VNREAREETNGGHIHLKKSGSPSTQANDLIFNPQLDTIYLPRGTLYYNNWLSLLLHFQPQHKKPIRKLAFDATNNMAIEVLLLQRVLRRIFNRKLNNNCFDSLEEMCLVERRTGVTRSEHVFKPGAQIMIGGEAWGQNILPNSSGILRNMLTTAMGEKSLEFCTVKIMILGDNDLS
jgi:hypothetical protein